MRPRTASERLARKRKAERTEQLRRELAQRRFPMLPKPKRGKQ